MTKEESLVNALRLARLAPKERFTKENITAIHKGIEPYYEVLTGYKLPNEAVIVGFGYRESLFGGKELFDNAGCAVFGFEGCFGEAIYYCELSTATKNGWIDANDPAFKETFKWITDRAPTKEDSDDDDCVAAPFEVDGWRVRCLVDVVREYRQPWARISDAEKATPEELANIPAEFRWPEQK